MRTAATPRSPREPVDVVVVGAGVGGAITTMVLAEAGLRVVCLEQGGWIRPTDHPHASPDWEWQRLTRWNTAPNVRRLPADYPIDTDDERTLMWNAVGGSTIVYTATWPRFRPSDFRKGTEHGLAPDWPITYEDLAPYYDAIDQMVGVSGWLGDPAIPPRGPFTCRPLPPGSLGRTRVRPPRVALVADAVCHPLGRLRGAASLQQLRELSIGLLAWLAQRCLADDLAACVGSGSRATHPCSSRAYRDRRSRTGNRCRLHRSDDRNPALPSSRSDRCEL